MAALLIVLAWCVTLTAIAAVQAARKPGAVVLWGRVAVLFGGSYALGALLGAWPWDVGLGPVVTFLGGQS